MPVPDDLGFEGWWWAAIPGTALPDMAVERQEGSRAAQFSRPWPDVWRPVGAGRAAITGSKESVRLDGRHPGGWGYWLTFSSIPPWMTREGVRVALGYESFDLQIRAHFPLVEPRNPPVHPLTLDILPFDAPAAYTVWTTGPAGLIAAPQRAIGGGLR